MLCPLIAHPLSAIDSNCDELRSEGEHRLRLLRPVLRSATAQADLKDLCNIESKDSFPALLGPTSVPFTAADRDQYMQTLEQIKDSVLSTTSDHKPCVARVENTTCILSTEEADKLSLIDRCACIPVQGMEAVVHPGQAPSKKQPISVTVTWSKKTFACSRASPRMILTAESDTCVSMTIVSCSGAHKVVKLAKLPPVLVTRLFEENTNVDSPSLAPDLPPTNTVPERLQMNLAAFFQNRMRASVLISAAAPDGVSRPLCFDSMRFANVNTPKFMGFRITAKVHPTAARCLCRAHNLDDIKMRCRGVRFSGESHVQLTMQMCGRAIGDNDCELHRNSTVRNKFAPGVCCAQCTADFHCYHSASTDTERKNMEGIWIPVPLQGLAYQELTMILAAVANYDRLSHDFRAEPARVALALNTAVNGLDEQIARFEQEALLPANGQNNPVHSKRPRPIEQMDGIALRMLQDGGIVQAKRGKDSSLRRLVRSDQSELDKVQKEAASSHHWLFPRPGQPFQTREQAMQKLLLKKRSSPSLRHGPHREGPSRERPSSSEPLQDHKQQRVRDPAYKYNSLTEFVDVRAVAECRRQIAELCKGSLSEAESRRADMFLRWMDVMDQECGAAVDGPLGFEARPLICDYRERHGGGRIYATGMKTIEAGNGKAKTVCVQGAPRELRPFLCGRFGHDFDLKNCQPIMLYQLPRRLTWADERKPPDMTELGRWCNDRPEWIEHVAEFHSLPSDEDRFPEYRKDTVKELMIRLMFGGAYEGWIKEHGFDVKYEPRSERVQTLARELANLRTAVFESHEWIEFVGKDRERLRKAGKKETEDDIDKSVFARIAQTLENQVLTSMRAYLNENGWTALTLCFDGLIVQHRPERVLNLAAMNARILKDTQFELEVVEKALYSTEFPVLSLARAK